MNQQERIIKKAEKEVTVIHASTNTARRYGKIFRMGFVAAVQFTLENLWIPVEEDFPELRYEGASMKWSDKVLVRLDNGYIMESAYLKDLKDSGINMFCWSNIVPGTNHVTHWMPIPTINNPKS